MNDQRSEELQELEALMNIAREHDLDAMLVEDGEYRVELVRREPAAPVAAQPVPAVAEVAASAQTAPPAENNESAQAAHGGETVTAPIIGVFYRAPSPTAPVFVNVGDRVRVGQTLCILEAMKLMNEITAETAGTITAILPENGELVSIGQPLFHIKP